MTSPLYVPLADFTAGHFLSVVSAVVPVTNELVVRQVTINHMVSVVPAVTMPCVLNNFVHNCR